MPGMMETVLNIGLTSKTIDALVRQTTGGRAQKNGDQGSTSQAERFAYDVTQFLSSLP